MATLAAAPRASTSTSNIHQEEEVRPQAGPLPAKRGEIGYVEGLELQEQNRSSSPELILPARHPADRDPEQGSVGNSSARPSGYPPPPPVAGPSSSTTSLTSSSSPDSVAKQKQRKLFGLFKCKCKHKSVANVKGIYVTTLAKFTVQMLVFAGSVVAWVFVTRFLDRMRNEDKKVPGGPSSTIFVHAVFGIAALAQILFIERRIFRMRAERYGHQHPGEMLPRYRNEETGPDSIMALSPWNRPPLPTYAAAIAQSGAGTGDVEDNIIAQQAPPAYGNTRGSTFLLSGFLNEDVRAARPPSVHSTASMPPDRPRSYASRDEEWEVIQDADRAMRLEETLGKLERSVSRT